jgi:D-sedoheptulose 7-phosphate isomerase
MSENKDPLNKKGAPMDLMKDISAYCTKLSTTLGAVSKEEIHDVLNVLIEARDAGKQVFTMGNGGSAATASHFVCDFNKGASYGKKKRFKFICLNDNVPTTMAYANDVSYDDIFIEQLKNLFTPGDIVLGISGSGNSKNVLKAIEYANANQGITIGLTGFDGGKLKQLVAHGIHIPIDDMQIVEDLHMVMDHLMMKILAEKLS